MASLSSLVAGLRRLTRCVLLPVFLLIWPAAHGRAEPGLADGVVFGRAGKRFTDFRPLPKWSGVLERYEDEKRRDGRCLASGHGDCPFTEWRAFVTRLNGRDRATQIDEVNRFANDWRYVSDEINWGLDDYWETPGEFFAKAGDCEDYAIVKFMTLRALGFRNDEVSLVAVMDLNLQTGHAVALADVRGKTFVLDNQVERVVPASSVHHYKPVFSANEDVWWLYQ